MDEKLINKYKIPNNENLNNYAMGPIYNGSLLIKNGVMFILGGVSSGKSTLLSKLMAVYTKAINPIILCFYSGLTPDETTQFALSSFNIKPNYIRLPTVESMYSFFNQYRFKRLKLAEILMFIQSVFKSNNALILSSLEVVEVLNGNNKEDKLSELIAYFNNMIMNKKININNKKGFIYSSEYINKIYSRKHKINFESEPALFIINCLVSLSKGFKNTNITVDILNDPTNKPNPKNKIEILNRFHLYTLPPNIRIANTKRNIKIEITPSICIFDDVASFPLLTAERSNQWTKDLFAETRRWINTFIIAAQRHNLLNKTLRSLTHTFFIGYSIVDDDVPRIAKEIPSNLLSSEEFKLLYNRVIKPFTFFVYNNKLGYNIIKLK